MIFQGVTTKMTNQIPDLSPVRAQFPALQQKDEVWKRYHTLNHTSTLELAKIAQQTQPGLLILYHTLFWGASEQDILNEISQSYQGKVVVGRDLQIFE